MNSKIFFRRIPAGWTVKTQRKRISSNLKNGLAQLSRYGINQVNSQNVFRYGDFRSYLKANYPKSFPFALKNFLAFKIH